jgi:hypothetical protein
MLCTLCNQRLAEKFGKKYSSCCQKLRIRMRYSSPGFGSYVGGDGSGFTILVYRVPVPYSVAPFPHKNNYTCAFPVPRTASISRGACYIILGGLRGEGGHLSCCWYYPRYMQDFFRSKKPGLFINFGQIQSSWIRIPNMDPDPGQPSQFGSMRIRIHNTGKNSC